MSSSTPAPEFYEPSSEKRKAANRSEGVSEPKSSSNTVAYDGKIIKSGEIPPAGRLPMYEQLGINTGPQSAAEYFSPVDKYDVEEINARIDEARIQLIKTNDLLHRANRKTNECQYAYKAALSRAIISTSGGTERSRMAAADLHCEQEYGELLVAQQAEQYLKTLLQSMRANLDALTQMSHNIRAQMNIL